MRKYVLIMVKETGRKMIIDTPIPECYVEEFIDECIIKYGDVLWATYHEDVDVQMAAVEFAEFVDWYKKGYVDAYMDIIKY